VAGAADEGRSATPPGAGVAPSPRRPWQSRRVLLGVTGGIAAYKCVQLARDLTQLGAQVDVVMTQAAHAFVGPVSFEGVTGRPVHDALIAEGQALAHIRLAREADVVCIAPATADFLARAAAGRADDLIGAVLLATRAPVLICPAMNDAMWSHPQTQANAARLAELGYGLVGPATGPLAAGEGAGPGRLEEPAVIVEHIGRALAHGDPMNGRRVLITAGPTREPVDPVRVLTNRSSGRMGFAVAAAAWRRGADVTLIAGPTELPPPAGPRLVRVESAEEMATAVRAALPAAELFVMVAAVADFRPAEPAMQKIKKRDAPAGIALEPAPDVLSATRDARADGVVTVGFALETTDGRVHAREKLAAKALDLIVLNPGDARDAGFEVDTNRVVLLDRDGGEEELPLMRKDDIADILLDRAALRLPRRRD
jgi:phosphopantothenoylcysteine decarboxylase / phosphopantothenate---cysteine ligase